MPQLKPPEPQIAMRKLFIRIEEMTLRMKRSAEFVGTADVTHVVAQAQPVFKRDSQFKFWLRQNPEDTCRT
jgi:hypothetical protein